MKEEETYYCKQLLKTGEPIVVIDTVTGKKRHTDNSSIKVKDDHGQVWIIEMIFTPNKKLNKSGVRVKLVVRKDRNER